MTKHSFEDDGADLTFRIKQTLYCFQDFEKNEILVLVMKTRQWKIGILKLQDGL